MPLVTEEQAKEMWCPEARVATWETVAAEAEGMATYNRPFKGVVAKSECNCIASKCMFWRWGDTHMQVKEPRGYCGKAGKP